MGLVSDTNQCSTNNGDQETKLFMDNQVTPRYWTRNDLTFMDAKVPLNFK